MSTYFVSTLFLVSEMRCDLDVGASWSPRHPDLIPCRSSRKLDLCYVERLLPLIAVQNIKIIGVVHHRLRGDFDRSRNPVLFFEIEFRLICWSLRYQHLLHFCQALFGHGDRKGATPQCSTLLSVCQVRDRVGSVCAYDRSSCVRDVGFTTLNTNSSSKGNFCC